MSGPSQEGGVRIQSVPRTSIPADVGVERWLVARVVDAAARGRAGPVAVVVRPDAVDAIALSHARRVGVPTPWFLAGLTTSVTPTGPAEAVGVIGRATQHRGASSHAVLQVFLEWGDNRWWHWTAVVDDQGRVRPGTEVVREAGEGDPLPAGLGRWWSVARRRGFRLDLGVRDGASGLVH